MSKYVSMEQITTVSGKTSAPITYTATEDMDCVITVHPVGSGVGGGNYTTKILIDDEEIVSSLSQFFLFVTNRTRFITLKKGQTVKVLNSGNATTATDFAYVYSSFLYKLITE